YEMIKTRFPDNKFSRIAMMRLAEIYQDNGEYKKCIQEIEDLLSTHPRGLRYEAMKLMQKAYETLYARDLKADEYTKVIKLYEQDHERIDRMSSRKISLQVGQAYLQARLYEESFNHMINAYKQYKSSERAPELLFGLGVAMDESGKDKDALTLFNAFIKRFPKHKKNVEALTRMGNIYLAQKKYNKSSTALKKAYKRSKKYLEKGEILFLHSNVFEQKGDLLKASEYRVRSAKDFASAKGENYDILAHVYKELGNSYLGLRYYVKAADAFSKALGFSDDDRIKANLGFLLGDAYQKGNSIQKAKEAFETVASTYDSVWARLARQRLTTLELSISVQNT
ncbi:MAG: tetratricopeptide repeat protein, partial [Desulfobacteraceae bacterium]|nr:tetratricopeptide repeat protein [Desulfobacteraceae bacterium]